MVIIRMNRKGSKNKPFYNLVVADSKKKRDGIFIEKLGYYNPITCYKEKKFFILKNRLKKWLKNGAQVSKTVKYLIKTYA